MTFIAGTTVPKLSQHLVIGHFRDKRQANEGVHSRAHEEFGRDWLAATNPIDVGRF